MISLVEDGSAGNPQNPLFQLYSHEFVIIQPCFSWEHDDSHKFGGSKSETDASGKVTRSPSLINDNYIEYDITSLAGGLEHVFHILGKSSQLTNSYFSEGWLNHQPVMI